MADVELPTCDQIEQRSHELFLERGGEEGHDIEDWLAAEKELTELAMTKFFLAATQLAGEQKQPTFESRPESANTPISASPARRAAPRSSRLTRQSAGGMVQGGH